MKTLFKPGDEKVHRFVVTKADIAQFTDEKVHEVCATFTLAREVEWAGRLFVKEMLEEGEEGIGTMLSITHRGPALLGQTVEVRAKVASWERNELICDYQAFVGTRCVAEGQTGQRILQKEKLEQVFEQAKAMK